MYAYTDGWVVLPAATSVTVCQEHEYGEAWVVTVRGESNHTIHKYTSLHSK